MDGLAATKIALDVPNTGTEGTYHNSAGKGLYVYDNTGFDLDKKPNDVPAEPTTKDPEKAVSVADEDDVEEEQDDCLLYNVTQSPPLNVTIICGFQQALLSLSASVAVSFWVADVVCADNNQDFKYKLLSSSLFMTGITTLLMLTLGIRLPLFQGAAPDFLVPLMSMAALNTGQCVVRSGAQSLNETLNATEAAFTNMTLSNYTGMSQEEAEMENILRNTRMLQGSLMAAGVIQCLLGATGLVGILLRFIGPVTIVPAILLIGIYLMKGTVKFAKVHWGISLLTCAISIILALYLSKWKPPIPVWTRKKGFHIVRYPVHQVFAILIAMLVGWALSAIITAAGGFPDDKNSPMYKARTDAQTEIISDAEWFHFPYPGQFGPISISVSVFFGFLVATITSVLDSVGDYYACASMCRVPPPPSHSVNRGIAIEGLCGFLAGSLGCGHATTTYGGNIGAIGVTRVASRNVFYVVAIIYIVFGCIGKICAVFITIPYPVLGGALITMYGMFNGVVLSNLQFINLTSTRNLAVIGISLLVGLAIPYWIEGEGSTLVMTGNKDVDQALIIILGNPTLSGGLLACFLDNTVPGTRDERGITIWQEMAHVDSESAFREGYEVYDIWMPKILKQSRIRNWIPFLPNKEDDEDAIIKSTENPK